MTDNGGRICSFRLPSSDLCLLSSSLEVRINETQLDGKMDQFDGRIDIEFLHDVRPVRLYRTDADIEHVCDLPGGVPFGNELENLPFSV